MSPRLPIKVLAPLVFGVPVLVLGLWLSIKWNRQSEQAVTELANSSIEQVHRTISSKVVDVLSIPTRVCRVNQHLVTSGTLPPEDLPAWRATFVEESRAFDMLSSIVWGAADGRAAWVSRYADGARYWAIKEDPTTPTMDEWKLDRYGEIVETTHNEFEFRLHARPWYRSAVEARQATWSEPYVWVGGVDSQGSTLGISYGVPVYGDDEQLLGVIDADYSLNDLSTYLGRQQIGESGVAALVAGDGRLIATSTDTAMVDDDGARLSAADSTNPMIAAAAATPNHDDDNTISLMDISGRPHFVHASRVGDQVGLDWTLLTVVPKSDFTADIESEFSRSWLTSLAAVALAVALGLAAARWLVGPLAQLAHSVRRIGQGDLETRIHVRHAPEYERLAEEINKMAVGLQDRMRMQRSLSLAMEVQRNLLPAEDPELRGLDIAGHSTYCDETGGDYYDFLDVSGTDQDSAMMVIGDVMGHGVAAALLMATARGILRSRCESPGSLADFLTHLNDMLVVDTQGERFMTMLLVTLSAEHDELRWASAGHGPPIVYDQTTDTFPELDGGGLPLGLMEGESYQEDLLTGVGPGTIILGTTDGLEETANSENELFGADRLRALLREHASKSAEEISQAIRQALAAHRGSGSQDDDLTFVVAKVLK